MNSKNLESFACCLSKSPSLACLNFSPKENPFNEFNLANEASTLQKNYTDLVRAYSFANIFNQNGIDTKQLNHVVANYCEYLNDCVKSKDCISAYFLAYIYCSFLVLSLQLSIFKRDSEVIEEKIQRLSGAEEETILFRGQADSSWGLLPSMFRDANCHGDIDKKWIEDQFTNKGYLKQYNLCFKQASFEHNTEELFAFYQHCISYSPFIDFSSSIKVAASFATTLINQKYKAKDGCILVIPNSSDDGNTSFNDAFNKTRITFLGSSINVDSLIRGKMLYQCNRTFFQPKFYLDSTPTNDKMQFQKGLLLFFYDCFVLNNRIIYPINQGENMDSILIPYQRKTEIYEFVVRERMYKQKFLNNPYRFFIAERKASNK